VTPAVLSNSKPDKGTRMSNNCPWDETGACVAEMAALTQRILELAAVQTKTQKGRD